MFVLCFSLGGIPGGRFLRGMSGVDPWANPWRVPWGGGSPWGNPWGNLPGGVHGVDPWEDPSGMVALIEAQPDGRQTEWARGMGRERIKTANKIAHGRAWLRPTLQRH